jgi:hypothetical protein
MRQLLYTMGMKRVAIFVGVLAVIGAAAYLVSEYKSIEPSDTVPQSWECNADAKVCPDGSSVGRTGRECQFAACPDPNAMSATLTTYMDGKATGLNVTIQPRELVSDSRCPKGVGCAWIGTVEVRAALSTQVAHGEHVFVFGEPHIFGDFKITLTEVIPVRESTKEIPISSYRFTFTVEKQK